MCPETITKILEYVDDTTILAEFIMIVIYKNIKNTLASVYQWQQNNNMMCDHRKPSKDIYYLHLGMKNLIEPSVQAKDLGIYT